MAYQPVYVNLSILNNSGVDIEIDLGVNGKANLEFRILDESGTLVAEARLVPEKSMFVPGDLVVRRGKRFTADFILNEWYTFSSPGKYRIEGQILSPVEAEGLDPTQVEVNGTMALEVLPTGSEQLKKLCQDLVRKAVEPDSFLEGQDAVLALSQIRDPVAVPFLSQIVEKALFGKDLAILALGRIHNREAVEALIAVLSSPNVSERNLAAATLWKLQITIGEKDPELLKRVQEAIRPFFGGAKQR